MSPICCFTCITGLKETLPFPHSTFGGSNTLNCPSGPARDIVTALGSPVFKFGHVKTQIFRRSNQILEYKNYRKFSCTKSATATTRPKFFSRIFCAFDEDSQALPLNTSSDSGTDDWSCDYATLRLRIEGLRRQEAKQALRLAVEDPDLQTEDESLDGLSTVFVLLVHPGTDHEGFCCLKFGDQDFVLSFEGEEEAVRYAVMLEAQNFPMPLVEAVDTEDIRSFCKTGGHMMGVVPAGSLFIPPEAIGDEATSEHCTNQTALGPRVHSMEDMRQILNNLLEGGR